MKQVSKLLGSFEVTSIIAANGENLKGSQSIDSAWGSGSFSIWEKRWGFFLYSTHPFSSIVGHCSFFCSH
jgi:hypothetical protein